MTKYYQQSLTGLLTAYWRVCTRCKFEKLEEMKYLSQVNAQEETTPGDKKVRLLQKEVDGTKTSRAENQMFTFQCEKSRRGLQVEVKQKRKHENNAKREEIASVGLANSQCSLGDSCAFKHEANKKGKGKGRPFTFSDRSITRKFEG